MVRSSYLIGTFREQKQSETRPRFSSITCVECSNNTQLLRHESLNPGKPLIRVRQIRVKLSGDPPQGEACTKLVGRKFLTPRLASHRLDQHMSHLLYGKHVTGNKGSIVLLQIDRKQPQFLGGTPKVSAELLARIRANSLPTLCPLDRARPNASLQRESFSCEVAGFPSGSQWMDLDVMRLCHERTPPSWGCAVCSVAW